MSSNQTWALFLLESNRQLLTFAERVGVSPQLLTTGATLSLVFMAALASSYYGKRYLQTDSGRQFATTAFLVVAYSLCSSMLLILNKVAVTLVPAPSFLLLLQLATCALFVKTLAAGRVVEAEGLQWAKCKSFILIVAGFIGTLYSNVTALKHVPVDTIICFRASCPIIIAVIEYAYLGRDLPSTRSWLALLGVFGGVCAYTFNDIHFTPLGYLWIGIWYTFVTFETVYVKKVVDTVQMTTWSRAYYQNALAVLPMLGIALVGSEPAAVLGVSWGWGAGLAVLATCIAGVGMSYFSFALRACISATSFSVIGNVCKVLTILVNIAIWEQHSNVWGTAALLACLAAGSMYEQAPLRQPPGAAQLPANPFPRKEVSEVTDNDSPTIKARFVSSKVEV